MPILSLLLGASIATAPVAAPRVAPAWEQPVLEHAQPAVATPRYPALWVINDDDTIIFLFGTFHALDERSDWFGQAVRTAFTASNELMLETLVPKASVGRPVGNLTPWQHAPGPSPMAQLAPSASHLATTKLVMNEGRNRGLSTAHGADAVLRNAAELSGKHIGGLESFQFQMEMFNSLPRQPAPPPQRRDPASANAVGSMLLDLKAAWSRGDLHRFEPVLMKMQSDSPQLYRTMFAERNTRWANWIANRLKSPGTVFVAVGAGHLSGPDSVQKQLSDLGVNSARVN